MLYISNDFADLVLAKAIKHRGKVHTMFNDITSDWVSRGSSCALLGCRRGDTRQAVFQEVMALKPVRDLHAGLVEAATERQEWLVCSHDATYQVLFSAIGQVPMQQKQGEFHALHTFLGRSGAVPGFSLQRTEGPAQLTHRNSHGKSTPIFENGKPSISIRAIYTMAMLKTQRVYEKMKVSCGI